MTSQRLDAALVARGLYPTRSRARDAISRGTILVNDVLVTKPGEAVDDRARIETQDEAQRYVSRAALKLRHGLEQFQLSPEGCICLDLGAATGGFTQVLLEAGAKQVIAVDVGHGQFDQCLAADRRVTLIERLNARALSAEHLPEPPSFIVCDVSFISLTLALPRALAVAKPGAKLVALIKPQFEAGRAAMGKRGVVRDRATHARVCRSIAEWIGNQGWRVIGIVPSPVAGGDGNAEFLIAAEKLC